MKNPKQRMAVMTATDELYLPTRLVYEVYDEKRLRAWLENTACVQWHPVKQGWTWVYEGAARKLGFPQVYDQVPAERQPVVLASCYLVNPQTFHVYTRCVLRTVKFLVFFDQQVSRSIALGKFIDEYNFITTVGPGEPIPFPEDHFKDESKIEFFDLVGLMDSPDSPAKKQAISAALASAAERTLRPLERHRLEAFYEDGPTATEQTGRVREVMAGMQHESDKPIRPMEVISRIVSGRDTLFPGGSSK